MTNRDLSDAEFFALMGIDNAFPKLEKSIPDKTGSTPSPSAPTIQEQQQVTM